MRTIAKNFANQAKKITAQESEQSKKEEKQLLARLSRLALLPQGSCIDDVLGLTVRDVLERRLQTIVFKKGLAKSIKQARQFITHQHIALGTKLIKAPSYLVSVDEEQKLSFVQKSALSDEEHPERVVEKAKPKKTAKPKEKPKAREIKGKKAEEKPKAEEKKQENPEKKEEQKKEKKAEKKPKQEEAKEEKKE
jgi:small subunit ribosomal protein S4